MVALLQLALRDLEWIGVHEQDGLAGAIGARDPATRCSRGSCRRGPRAWPQVGLIACVPDPSMYAFPPVGVVEYEKFVPGAGGRRRSFPAWMSSACVQTFVRVVRDHVHHPW
jgi:hypothetical protein